MCGGVRFSYDPAYETQLNDSYAPEKLAQFRDSGVVESLFWQPRPVLPVLCEGQLQILDWGNREKQLRLPQTGWVRQRRKSAAVYRPRKPGQTRTSARSAHREWSAYSG